jgi:anti-sigma-K factor RskA
MRYHDPNLREALAAEYAFGSLRGAARRRFERLIGRDPAWRELLERVSARLCLLAEAAPARTPPPRVWRAIAARTGLAATRALRWWQALALISSTVAVTLAIFVGGYFTSPPASQPVAVLADKAAQAAWLLSVVPNAQGQPELRFASLDRIAPIPGKAFELWLLPSNAGAPVSLGLLPAQGQGRLPLAPAATRWLAGNASLAVSLEPAGGSATGQPTGPVLYQGRLAKL